MGEEWRWHCFFANVNSWIRNDSCSKCLGKCCMRGVEACLSLVVQIYMYEGHLLHFSKNHCLS